MRVLGALDATDESAPNDGPAAEVAGMADGERGARRMTVRDTVKAAALAGSAHARAVLASADIPRDLVTVFAWWAELHAQRGSSGFGLNPISYPDIDAWARLMREPVTPNEVRTLVAGDAAYLTGLHRGLPTPADTVRERDDDGNDLHTPELEWADDAGTALLAAAAGDLDAVRDGDDVGDDMDAE